MVEFPQDHPYANQTTAQYSINLTIIFYLTIIATILQLFLQFYRCGFTTIIALSLCYFVLFIGYYDSKSVWIILCLLSVSVLLDIFFGVLSILNSKIPTSFIHQPQSPLLFGFICYLLLLGVLIKMFLIGQLIPYRNIRQQDEYFQLNGRKFPLRKVLLREYKKQQIESQQ